MLDYQAQTAKQQKDYPRSLSYLQRRLKILANSNDFHGIALLHQSIGELLLEWRGQSEEEARIHFKKAITIAEDRIQ